MLTADKKPNSPYCSFLINLSHHTLQLKRHWEFNIINWGQFLDTTNLCVSLHETKFYKQRIMLNYQNIPGSHNDTSVLQSTRIHRCMLRDLLMKSRPLMISIIPIQLNTVNF